MTDRQFGYHPDDFHVNAKLRRLVGRALQDPYNLRRAKKDEKSYSNPQDEITNLEISNLKQSMDAREKYTTVIFRVVLGAVGLSFVLAILSGSEAVPFALPEKVLMTMMASTSANAVALLLVVFKHIYPGPGSILTPRRQRNPRQGMSR